MTLSFINRFMARSTNRNYIKPVFGFIAFVMVVILRLFLLTNRTYHTSHFRKFFCSNRFIDSVVCSYSFRMLLALFYIYFSLNLSAFLGACIFLCGFICTFFISFIPYLFGSTPFFWIFNSPQRSNFQDMLFFFQITNSGIRFHTSLACKRVSVFMFSAKMKFLNWFYNSAFITPFIHRNPQTKMPAATWVKHVTEGGFILARNALLDPTRLSSGIIS